VGRADLALPLIVESELRDRALWPEWFDRPRYWRSSRVVITLRPDALSLEFGMRLSVDTRGTATKTRAPAKEEANNAVDPGGHIARRDDT